MVEPEITILNPKKLQGRLSSAAGVDAPVPGNLLVWKDSEGNVSSVSPAAQAPVTDSTIVELTVAVPIGSSRVIRNSSGQAIGVSRTAGTTIQVVLAGRLQDSGWLWDLEKPIFAAYNDTLTQVPPTTG